MVGAFMLAVAGINIIKRAYFALDLRDILLVIGGGGVVITAVLGLLLAREVGVRGLAGALSVSTILQFAAYVFALQRFAGIPVGMRSLIAPFAKMGLASGPSSLAAWGLCLQGDWTLGPTVWNAAVLGLACITAMVVYVGAAKLLGLREVHRVLARVLRRR